MAPSMLTKVIFPSCVTWVKISYQSYGRYSFGRINNSASLSAVSGTAFICAAKFVVIVTILPTLVTWKTQWEKLVNMELVGGSGA